MKEDMLGATSIDTFLTFEMNKELFAVNVSKILNILEVINITKVPKAKTYMKGVINLRGSVLPVVDLRIKFGLPEKEYTKDTSIIVMNIIKDESEVMLGALVDAVHEVREIKENQIVPPPPTGTRYNSELISGLLQLDEKFIMLLDIDKVFLTDEVVNVKSKKEKVESENN